MAVESALHDDDVLLRKEAEFYIAEVGTKMPKIADLASKAKQATALTAWKPFGHLSEDTGIKLNREGGDQTTKGSLQKPKLRVDIKNVEFSMEVGTIQFDKSNLKRIFGMDATEGENGFLGASINPQTENVAVLVIVKDADRILALGGEKVAVAANGEINLTDAENFVSAPLKFTFLQGADGRTLWVSPVTKIAA